MGTLAYRIRRQGVLMDADWLLMAFPVGFIHRYLSSKWGPRGLRWNELFGLGDTWLELASLCPR